MKDYTEVELNEMRVERDYWKERATMVIPKSVPLTLGVEYGGDEYYCYAQAYGYKMYSWADTERGAVTEALRKLVDVLRDMSNHNSDEGVDEMTASSDKKNFDDALFDALDEEVVAEEPGEAAESLGIDVDQFAGELRDKVSVDLTYACYDHLVGPCGYTHATIQDAAFCASHVPGRRIVRSDGEKMVDCGADGWWPQEHLDRVLEVLLLKLGDSKPCVECGEDVVMGVRSSTKKERSNDN
jgi:hypothetical protein